MKKKTTTGNQLVAFANAGLEQKLGTELLCTTKDPNLGLPVLLSRHCANNTWCCVEKHTGKQSRPVGGCAAQFESKAAYELITLCGCLVIQTGTLSAIYTNKKPLELAAHHLHQWEFMARRQTETCTLGDVAVLMRGELVCEAASDRGRFVFVFSPRPRATR